MGNGRAGEYQVLAIEGDLKNSGQVTFNDLSKGQAEVALISQTIPPTTSSI
jgi:hypothetical protein